MMQSRIYLVVIIFLIILLSTILVFNNPYAGEDTTESSDWTEIGDIDLDELIDQTVRQIKSVETYFQDTEITYRYSDITNNESANKSLDMVMISRVDNNRRLHWSSINSTFDEG